MGAAALMGFRRSQARHAAHEAWLRFVAHHAQQIEQIGLPQTVMDKLSHWDDFLLSGEVVQSDTTAEWKLAELSTEQYAALFQLIDSYFALGYEYFSPQVLKQPEQEVLDARYGVVR